MFHSTLKDVYKRQLQGGRDLTRRIDHHVPTQVGDFGGTQASLQRQQHDHLVADRVPGVLSEEDARVNQRGLWQGAFIAPWDWRHRNNKTLILGAFSVPIDAQTILLGPSAIVRFHWMSESEAIADGKKSSTNLHILMNWQKQGADWKLLSRAATKL